MIYWTEETKKEVINYIKTQTKEEKNNIYNKHLHKPLYQLTKQAIYTCSSNVDEDLQTDLLIFIIEKLLPKIKEEQIDFSLNFIWVSVIRKIYSYHKKKTSKRNLSIVEDDNDYSNMFYEQDQITINEDLKEIRMNIIDAIDGKIIQQEQINKTNTIILILLKDYLIENNYDARGFRTHCISSMGLKSKHSFWNIAHNLNIRTKQMNEDIINL